MPKVLLTKEQRRAEAIKKERKKIAEGLAAFKFRNRLNEEQVGSILGVSRYTVSNIINEKETSFTKDEIFKIIDAAGYVLVKKESAT